MLIWSLLYIALAIVIAATLAGFCGRIWWVFELFSHFRVQYFSATFLFALVFALAGKFTASGAAGVGALLNLVLILPQYFEGGKQKDTGEVHRLLLANVNTKNPHHDKVRRLIEEFSPEFVVLVEVDQDWLDDLGLDEIGYRHCVAEPRVDNYGIALYSRVPMNSSEIIRFGPLGMPSVSSSLQLGESILNIIGSHPPPPKSGQLARYRDQQIAEIMEHARSLEGGVIFCGDLNMTSWSHGFKPIRERGNLYDSRQSFGVQPSWPTWMPLLMLPLDHIWVSRHIKVHNREIGPRIGSDHRPVILDFSLAS